MWSAFRARNFDRQERFRRGGGSGVTQHALFDPATNSANRMTVSNTGHDMFCPSISTLFNGDIVVAGGQNSERTSVYSRSSESWSSGGDLIHSRGYASSTILESGRVRSSPQSLCVFSAFPYAHALCHLRLAKVQVFVLGGSWSGERGLKGAEIFTASSNSWSELPGINPAVIHTSDPQGLFRADNYGWFFGWEDETGVVSWVLIAMTALAWHLDGLLSLECVCCSHESSMAQSA